MTLILLLVFSAAFAIMALLMLALSKPKTAKQTGATLAWVLKSANFASKEEIIDVRKDHLLSSIPWLHNLLSRVNVALEMRRMLTQADLTWTPGRLVVFSLAIWFISGYLIGLRMHSMSVGMMLGLLPGAGPLLYVIQKRRQRLNRIQQKLPEALDLMVSALRAGQSMGGALGAAAREAPEPLGREFRLCFEEQNFGIDLRTAMNNLLERVPLQDVRMITTAMLIHKESGGNLSEVLEKTAHLIRERFQIMQQIRVHTAQGRLTGWILSLLPLALGMVIYMVSPGYMDLLFNRPVGHKIVAGAAAMNFVGLLIIRRIVKIRI